MPASNITVPRKGVRKIRYPGQNRGKSGGYRVIYYYYSPEVPLYALLIYGKGEQVDLPQVRRIRQKLGLSQEHFARLLGVSTSGLRKWEQGQRAPRGAAATLLCIMEREPQAVARALIEEHRRTDAGNRAS